MVNYLPLTGGIINGLLNIQRSPSIVKYTNEDGTANGYLGVLSTGPAYYTMASKKYDIVHEGNINKYSAGSAAKLSGNII